MLDIVHTDSVTIRRAVPGSRTATNAVQYEEVKAEDTDPIVIRCRIERRKRRVHNLEGVEMDADASLVYRKDRYPQLQLEDLVYNSKRNEVYRIITFEDADLLFCSNAQYGRLSLQIYRATVPGDGPRG